MYFCTKKSKDSSILFHIADEKTNMATILRNAILISNFFIKIFNNEKKTIIHKKPITMPCKGFLNVSSLNIKTGATTNGTVKISINPKIQIR